MADRYQQLDTNQLLGEIIQRQFDKGWLFPKESEPNAPGNAYKKTAFTVQDMHNTFIDLNKSFEYVGDNSTAQKRITWILSIQWVAFTFMVMGMTYIFRPPKFFYTPLGGKQTPCSEEIYCHYRDNPNSTVEILADYSNKTTLSKEFELVCERKTLVVLAESMFFTGGLVSGYLFSYFSNMIGRRSMLIITMAMAAASVLACVFAPTMEVFIICYFFSGFNLFGYETQVYGYISEVSAARFRAISLNILMIVWAGAPIFFPLMNLLTSWKYVFVFMALPLVSSLPFMYFCFMESPRFLVSKGYYKQAREIFRQISITNGRPPYEFRLIEEMEYENNTVTHINSDNDRKRKVLLKEAKRNKKRQYNYFDLFRYRSLRSITLVLMVLWLVRFFMYYSINLALESIATSGFMLSVVVSLSAFSEVLGAIGTPVMTTYFFHKKKIHVMRMSLLVATVCCCLLWFVGIPLTCRTTQGACTEIIISLTLILIIKFFMTTFYAGLQSYTPQMYPTDVRSLGLGFVLTLGRLGTVIVPSYIIYMKQHYFDRNPLSFLAPCVLIATLLSWRMPDSETEGLKEHLDEELPSRMIRETELVQMNRNMSAGQL